MQLIALLIAFLHWTPASTTVAAVEQRNCTSPTTRAAIKAAVQDKLTEAGLPRELPLFTMLDQLRDGTSDQAKLAQRRFASAAHLKLEDTKVCEVLDPELDAPMFVTLLYVNPNSGQPGGLVFNFGLGRAIATFGDDLSSVLQ